MGICNLITGTFLIVLLQFPPTGFELSDKQLVDGSQSVIMVDHALGSKATPNTAFAIIVDMIQVRPFQPRARGYEVGEKEGNVQDGYVLHFPAPT